MRVGSKMDLCGWYVRMNPGCTMLAAAEYVGPHGSRRYGYQIVSRTIAAGLIEAKERHDKAGCFRLYPLA